MRLQLNGAPIEAQATTLADLLDAYGFTNAKVATAVNGKFVAVSARPDYALTDGDQVEILAPMQGG
ncbi:sulfur carrier protein ThiS [Loktanella sp. R86503]|uniref:sulfur carrier protein ThiS n=1 Tax=Loktanella sp. R86503 TaxID=3093847 RepID=UPI0036DDEE41